MEPSVSAYLQEQASARRIDARSKIAMLAVYSVGIFFVDTWAGMALYAAALVAFAIAFKAPAAKVAKLGVPVYVICGLTVVFNMLTLPEGGVGFTQAGLVRGCFFAARILLLVWASLVICLTVRPTELTQAFSSILSPLRHLRVPVDDIAMVFTIALRFIPQMAEEYFQIRDAQWARCASFDEGSLVSRVKAHVAIMLPMMVALFRRADRLADSMDVRCYGMRDVRRTDIRARKIDATSVTFAAVASAALIAVSVLL